MIKPLTAAEQEEFNRIDSEVTSFGTATGKELGSWQGFGEASKALFSPSASAGTALGMAASAPAVLWDAGKSFVTGEKTTEASDAMFRAVDDYARSAETFWRPNPDAMGGVARVGSMGFQLAGTLPQIAATPSVAISGMSFSPTMDAIDQGASPEAVAKIGATTLGVNAFSWAIPAAWGKTVLGRVGTGAISNAALGAVQEGVTGSVLLAEGNKAGENYRWDNYENRFFEMAMGGIIGAKFGNDPNIKAENDAATAPIEQPLPSKAEMAESLAHINQDHFTNTTLPGLPMNSDGIRQHTSALDTAIKQVLNGEPVNIADTLDMNNFLVRPEHRPPTYIPASPTGKSAGNYGIGFLSDPTVYDNFTQYRHALEVGGMGPSAKNPLSSATGNGQFIEATWLSLIKQHRPAWAKGLGRDELLALRTDPEITAEVLKLQDQGHAKSFMDAGLPVNFYTMYSAHHFGIGKGKAFAKADGDTPMTAILSAEQIDANGHLREMTKDQAQAYWDKQAKKQGAQGESLFVQPGQKVDNAIKPTEQGETYTNGLPKQLPEIDGSREADLLNQSLAIIRSAGGDGSGQQHAGVRVIDQGFVPEPIVRGLAAFTEATGVPITLVRNLSPEIKDFHGATVPGENRIYLNVDSNKPLVVAAGHELGHRMKEAAPDLYKPMQAEMKRQGFVPKYATERKLSARKALPELTNDAIGDAMGDTKFLNRMAKESPSLFQRVAGVFKEYLDGILAKLGATDYGTNRYLNDIEAFRDQLAYALREFGKRNGKIQGDLFADPGDARALFSDKYDDAHRPIPEDLPEFTPEPATLKPEERFAMPAADQVKADADHAKQMAEYEKQRNLRQKALSIVAGDKVRRAIIAFPGQPMQAIDHIIARSADAKGSVMSVESQAKGIREDAYRQLIPMLEASAPKFFGLLEDQEGVRQLVMELHGQKTGNLDAKNGAAAFRKVADTMKTRFNRAGGDIGTLEDWGMPHQHSQFKVAKAGKDAWVKKTLPMMNRAKYDMDDAELVEFLGEVWKTIAQNGVNKLVPGTFTGSGKVANRGNKARQLHFKDGEAYLKYQKDFGESSPYETLTGHIHSMAHDIAMIETLGPNPDQMIRTIIDEAYIASVDADPVNLPKHDKQKKWLETLYREVSGKARPVHSRKLASAFQAYRSLQVASKLGGAAITAGTDHATMHLAAIANNLPQMQLFANELMAFNPANAAERARMNRMGLGLSSIIGSVNRFHSEVSSTGAADKIAGSTMRASGLAATTDMRREAYGVTMMDAIGSVISKTKTLADLDPNDNRILLSKGITDTDFNVWKMAELEDMGANHTILTPDSIYAIPDAKLAGIVDEFGDAIDPDILRQQAVTKLLGATLEEVDIGIIEPGARERARLYGNSIRGTWKGELMISIMQFKSFPVSMILKHWQRTMSEPTPMRRAQIGALLMASTTIAGMATMQIAQLLVGKDPKDMATWEAWTAALLKGGGLSLFGDYFLRDQTQAGNSIVASLAGPIGGMAEDLYGLTVSNVHQAGRGEDTHIGAEMVKFAKSNTPFANLWYTRAATDHLIVNELQEMASPGYLKKMERRAEKQYGETYYWKPGTPFPQRKPDFDKATGQ